MSIQAITFDFWGTLFRDANGMQRHQYRVDAVTEATPLSEHEADETLQDLMAYFLKMHIETQHTLTPRDAVHLLAQKHALELDENTVQRLADAFGNAILAHPPEPISDALAAVKAASERFPVAIISDTGFSPGRNLRILLERERFIDYFSVLTFSDEKGVAKPQQPMFTDTAEHLGVKSDELLHIGDLEPTDIVGAHQVNSVAALFTAVNPRYAETTQAEYIFSDWNHFLTLLPSLA